MCMNRKAAQEFYPNSLVYFVRLPLRCGARLKLREGVAVTGGPLAGCDGGEACTLVKHRRACAIS